MGIDEFLKVIQTLGGATPSVLLAAALVAIIVGLATDKIAFGPQLTREREAHKTCNEALSKQTESYTELRIELVGLRKDREHAWSRLPSSQPPEQR